MTIDTTSTSDDSGGELGVLVRRFRREERYPSRDDHDQLAARQELLRILMPKSLDSAIEAPAAVDIAAIREIASGRYGGSGNQIQFNVHLKGGAPAVASFARSARHLLYGPGADVARLDDVLECPVWNVRGFGEALTVKCLAIVYPDRWLPLFLYPGTSRKRAMMQLPELPVVPLHESGKSRAQLATESNNVLRDLLSPYFGTDRWGPIRFLWWRLQAARSPSASSGGCQAR